jgi:uroporphyrinogen-III synthase
VAPYRSVAVRPEADRQRTALSADAVLFASGSAARAWAEAFGYRTPPIVVAIGPQTAVAAQQAGLKVTLIAADHSVKGMVDALASYLSRRS